MANTKEYKIIINGVQESINAVESLNKQLETLESKINALSSKAVNISSSSSVGGGSRSSELSEKEKLEKQISQIQERQVAYESEEYKTLLLEKEALKGIQIQQKSATAEIKLQNTEYANTMQGMKEHLKDIKAAMQTEEIGNERFNQLSKEAGEITQKLKEIEQAYGVFSRSVGNYASAAEGFKGLKITVGDTVMEFDNARQALKALKQEMQTLNYKNDKGLISEEESERLKSLIPTVNELESSIQDAGKPMDELMDTMQSIVAIAQAGKGIAAFFGFDNSKIEESIQKLVALQNVMQSLQTMQKQMQTGEGLFGAFSKASAAIDAMSQKLLGATKAAKALSLTLKTIGVGAVVGGVIMLIDYLNDLEEAEEKAEKESEKLQAKIDEQRQTFVNASVQYNNTASRISHLKDEFIKTNDQLRKTSILKEASAEFKKLGISINGAADAQKVLINQGNDVIQLLRLQGEAAALVALRIEAYKKAFNIRLENGYDIAGAAAAASYSEAVQGIDKRLSKVNEEIAKFSNNLGINTEAVEKNKKEVVDAEKTLESLRLRVMQDGLNKRLMQLDEEKRQTLSKLKSNSREYLEAEKLYNELRKREIDKYNEEISKKTSSTKYNNSINELDLKRERTLSSVPRKTGLLSEKEIIDADNGGKTVAVYYQTLEDALKQHFITEEELYRKYDEGIIKLEKEQQHILSKIYDETKGTVLEKNKEYYRAASEMLKEESSLYKNYGLYDEKNLSDSFERRLSELREYHDKVLNEVKDNLDERARVEKTNYVKIRVQAKEEEDKRWEDTDAALRKYVDEVAKEYNKQKEVIESKIEKDEELTKEEKELYDKRLKSLEDYQVAYKNHIQTLENIEKEYSNNIIKLENDTAAERSRIQSKYFDEQIANFRDFSSRLNKEISKQPIYDTAGFGIINYNATKKNFDEIKKAAETSLKGIQKEKENLSESFRKGFLSPDAYNSALSQLNDLESDSKEQLEQIDNDIKELGGQWWGSINEWIQQIGQAFNTVLSSLSEMQNNQYSKMIDEQEAWIKKYEDLLDKQKEITQKHADAVNSIEDELATARGDRRQHLIDQLNAEIAAQRESAAEQKKLERQKEAADHKKMELEYKQALEKKKLSIAQASLNAIMAVSMAAVNNWPIPAIPMMALASAAGAAQVAAAAAQYIPKPKYAKGGVLEGPSHSQGGIPVGNTGIEVEGQEYVIRKKSTKENVPVLDFINKSERKLTLDDFIDFYSTKPRATIKNIKSKFADGGILSTPNLDLSNTFERTIVVKDETPVVVSVVDVINKQADVRRVQALAGL